MTEEDFVPAVDSRWRFGASGTIYQIVEGKASEGYVLGRHVGSSGCLIGMAVELRLAGFGTTWVPAPAEQLEEVS